jgi:hypothetical protein
LGSLNHCGGRAGGFIVVLVAATNGLRRAAVAGLLGVATGCVSVDPGPDFVVPQTVFDANYFFCEIEPNFIFANSCGSGDGSKGDKPNGCHFNPSAVSGMALIDHPPVPCNGDIVSDQSQVGTGSPAESNLQAVSLEMSKDYTTAALYVRPSDLSGCPPPAHPRCVIQASDMTVQLLLRTWASK